MTMSQQRDTLRGGQIEVAPVIAVEQPATFTPHENGVTAPLLVPFVGLFRPVGLNGIVLELHSLVAIVVYVLVAWVLAKLAWLLLGETRRGVRTHSSSADTDVG